jgi:copper chaperone CopZ
MLAATALLVFSLLSTGCNEATQEAAEVATNTAAATPASTLPADGVGKSAEGGCGGCAGDSTTMTAAAGAEGCGGCGEAGAKEAGVTMAAAGGEDCSGDCGDGGDCGGDCGGEGGAKPAGGCSTCPGTAKTLTAMACDEKVVLKVDGMTCGSCENAIRETLAGVDGVKLGVADHEKGQAWVAYDPQVANVEVISAAISGLGYTVGGEVDHVAAMAATPAGHERAAIYVDKLGCGDCTPRINEALLAMDGVDACALDRQYNILFVDYDPAALQPVAFKDKMLEIGYAAALPGEALAQPEKAHCDECEDAGAVETASAANAA